MDAVVHGAALHGIHLQKWPPEAFWSVNVTGTFNLLEAARAAGVRRLVLCSTMAVYGASAEPPPDGWAMVTDDSPALPEDVYGMSKWLCEHLGRYYARRWAIPTVALRLGMFVPESFERYGFRLLFGGSMTVMSPTRSYWPWRTIRRGARGRSGRGTGALLAELHPAGPGPGSGP